MRLLHTTNLTVEDFSSRRTPDYAILSHRWYSDEVSYQDLRFLTEPDEARRDILRAVYNLDPTKSSGKGFDKIKHTCAFAAERGFEWLWVDTCCINRESSAELSEAINSMFKWYRNAAQCFVYLADFDMEQKEAGQFMKSEWFKRGWTLQELLAPRNLVFLDTNFHVIGSKESFAEEIEKATGIDAKIIVGRTPLRQESIATRMSWIARRSTTRPEDMAYSLLGIFNINMPLLYGEGNAAFTRLQEEIVRTSDDETIFAHTFAKYSPPSALAQHPRDFLRHKKLIRGLPPRFANCGIGTSPFTITNKGVQMRPAFVPLSLDSTERVMLLNCHFEGANYPVLVPIARVDQGDAFGHDASSLRGGSVWRIRIHADVGDSINVDDSINKAAVLIDHALRPVTRKMTPQPFECETIYLR